MQEQGFIAHDSADKGLFQSTVVYDFFFFFFFFCHTETGVVNFYALYLNKQELLRFLKLK